MELNEAFRRIVGQHWRLMLCFFIFGVGIAAIVHEGAAKSYTATARFVLDTQDPKSRAEAAGISDTGEAIATSPAQVRTALVRGHVNRNAVDVAAHHVSVHQLGSSGVLELSVSDRNPKAARAIANALAVQVIRVRNDVSNQSLLTSIDNRIASLNRQIVALDASGGLLAERDLLVQRRSLLESERVPLLTSEAQRPKPSIISPATLPSHPGATHSVPILALGGILGLLLGLGVAGLIELMRPTLVGEEALTREFEAPLLGRFSSSANGSPELVRLRDRVRVAGEAAGVHRVRLLAAGSSVDVSSIASALANGQSPDSRDVVVDIFDIHTWSPNGGGEGLAVVAPTALKQEDLADANRVLTLSKLPVLGVITYQNGVSLQTASRNLAKTIRGHIS
jgi:capsular polysaccharide biosynthesis protein